MVKRRLTVFLACWTVVLIPTQAVSQSLVVEVDLSVTSGLMRDLNGVNRRPGFTLRAPVISVDASELYAAFGVSQIRSHDTGLDLCETYKAATLTTSPPQTMNGCTVSGTPVGGIPTITWTPSSTADSALRNTSNYDFTAVDTVLSQVAATGAALYLRLGESYNGPNNTNDPLAWAKVAANLYRHVVGTFKPTPGIAPVAPAYVEIHNEPDGAFWRGSASSFYQLFRSTVSEVRAAASAAGRTVRVGGPGFTSSILNSSTVPGNPANGFIKGVGLDSLDFYSAHYYATCSAATLAEAGTFLRALRSHVDSQGGASLPLHLTEWNTGLGERCGSNVYSEPRMQSWTSGMLTLMQDPALNVEAAHFYSGVPVMPLFDLSTSPGSALINPSAWAFWAHARLRGMTRLAALVCQGSSCRDGFTGDAMSVMALAGGAARLNAVVVSNDNDSARSYTLRIRGSSDSLDVLIRTPPTGVVRASLSGTPGRLSEEAVRELLGQVTRVSRVGMKPVAGVIELTLSIPARSVQLVEMRPSGSVAAQMDCILDWGELHYPAALGPARQPSVTAGEYHYRYYPRSQFYVGTSLNQAQLLALDARAGVLQSLGPVSAWATAAGCI